jgi:FlaA1/EpsC-like NDP-sugar epimerase
MRRSLLLIAWLLTDVALFIGSYVLAYFLRVGWVLSTDFPFDRFVTVTVLVTPVWLATLLFTRTFALMRRQPSLRTGSYIAYAGVIGVAFFSLAYYFLYREFFSRLLLLYALPLSIVTVWIWHMAYETIQRTVLRFPPAAFPTLIIGATREASALIASLQRQRNPLKPVGILDGRGTKETSLEGVPVLGRLHKLDEILDKHQITHVIQCSDLEQSINLLSACRARGITYLLLPSLLGIIEHDERIESLEGRPVTVVRPKEKWWKWFVS